MSVTLSNFRLQTTDTAGRKVVTIIPSVTYRSTTNYRGAYFTVEDDDGTVLTDMFMDITKNISKTVSFEPFNLQRPHGSAETITLTCKVYTTKKAGLLASISKTLTLRAAYTATANIRDSVDDSIIASRTAYEGDDERPSATITQSDLETQTGKKWDHFNLARDDSSTLYDTYDKYPFPHTGRQPITTTGLTFDLYAFWQQGGPKIKVKVDGAWEEGELKAKVNGEWVDADAAYVKVNGAWMEIN